MRTRLGFVAILLASFLNTSLQAAYAAYETPTSNKAYTFEPLYYRLTTGLRPARQALTDQLYNTRAFLQPYGSPTAYAGDTLAQYLSSGYGVFAILTHGASFGALGIESFPYTPEGEAAANARLSNYVSRGIFNYTEAAVYPIGPDQSSYPIYMIAVQDLGIKRYTNPSNALVHVAACYGGSSAWAWGARVVASYGLSCPTDDAVAGSETFWNQLSNGFRDTRYVGSAAQWASLTVYPAGDPGYVVLSPAIQEVSPQYNSTISSPVTATVTFDTKMNTAQPVSNFLTVLPYSSFTISNRRWVSDTQLAYAIFPQYTGSGVVEIQSAYCYSSGGISLNPDGVGPKSGDDFFVNYNTSGGPNPVSRVTSYNAVRTNPGHRIAFTTAWEYAASTFELFRVDSSGDSAVSLGITPAVGAGGGHYIFADASGLATSRYRLVEHQTWNGPDLPYGFAEGQDSAFTSPSEPVSYNQDSLAAVVAAYDDPIVEVPPEPCVGLIFPTPEYAILCPDSFATSLGSYASLWRNRGISTRVIPFSVADSCAGGFLSYIRGQVQSGLKYVLLVGDANDASWWDDPTKWTNGWVWPRVGTSGPHIPSQPERNLIPTFYTAVADSPQISMGAYTPYFSSDLPYADTDMDGLPDVALGRLPASSVADINAYTAKLSTYLSAGGGVSWTRAYELTYAQDNGEVQGDQVEADADSTAGVFPISVNLTRFTDTNASAWTYDHRESLADSAANSGPDLITWISSGSQRYIQGNYWRIDRGWSMSRLAPPATAGRFFLSLGFSCDMGNFDQTEEYASYDSVTQTFSNPIRPIAERLLFDPQKGAIACIGPSRGTFQPGNRIFGREMLRHLYSGGKNLGTALLLAKRTAVTAHPEYANVFRSYNLLGDPVIGAYPVTAVEEGFGFMKTGLDAPHPNPFNPSTTIMVRLGTPMSIRLGVYDIHGKLVRLLIPEEKFPAGDIRVLWDGRSQLGKTTGSGVYFVRLEAGEHHFTRKIVLLK